MTFGTWSLCSPAMLPPARRPLLLSMPGRFFPFSYLIACFDLDLCSALTSSGKTSLASPSRSSPPFSHTHTMYLPFSALPKLWFYIYLCDCLICTSPLDCKLWDLHCKKLKKKKNPFVFPIVFQLQTLCVVCRSWMNDSEWLHYTERQRQGGHFKIGCIPALGF